MKIGKQEKSRTIAIKIYLNNTLNLKYNFFVKINTNPKKLK